MVYASNFLSYVIPCQHFSFIVYGIHFRLVFSTVFQFIDFKERKKFVLLLFYMTRTRFNKRWSLETKNARRAHKGNIEWGKNMYYNNPYRKWVRKELGKRASNHESENMMIFLFCPGPCRRRHCWLTRKNDNTGTCWTINALIFKKTTVQIYRHLFLHRVRNFVI